MRHALFLIFFMMAGTSWSKDSSSEFQRLTDEQHKKYDQLLSDLGSQKKCTGVDFACVLREIEAIGLRCGNDLSYAANLVLVLQRRKLAMDKDCGDICQLNLHAQVAESLLRVVKSYDHKKTFLYANLTSTDGETSFLRANDDLQAFRHLQKLADTLIILNQRIDPEKIFDKALALKAQQFSSEITGVQKAVALKGSYLSRLPPESPVFRELLKVGETPQEVDVRKRLIEDFKKAMK